MLPARNFQRRQLQHRFDRRPTRDVDHFVQGLLGPFDALYKRRRTWLSFTRNSFKAGLSFRLTIWYVPIVVAPFFGFPFAGFYVNPPGRSRHS